MKNKILNRSSNAFYPCQFAYFFFFTQNKKKKRKKERLPIDNSIKPLKTYIQVTLQERFKTHKGKEKKAWKSSP